MELKQGKKKARKRKRLPQAAVMAPSLPAFKNHLDNTLRHVV